MLRTILVFASLVFTAALTPFNANAEQTVINVSPEGPQIVRLAEDAASVIVGNPTHATALLENPRTLIISGNQAGMTGLIVLGRNGEAILDARVIVGALSKDFIRINRACANGAEGCLPVSMYYCADGMCHPTATEQPPVASGSSGAGGGEAGGEAGSGMQPPGGGIMQTPDFPDVE